MTPRVPIFNLLIGVMIGNGLAVETHNDVVLAFAKWLFILTGLIVFFGINYSTIVEEQKK